MQRLLVIAALAACTLAGPAHADRITRKTVMWDGVEREYYVHTPNRVRGEAKLPMVLALHGGGGKGGGMRATYGFKPSVDAGRVIAVYPSAINGSWAVGGLPTANARVRPDHDDVGFLDAVVDEVVRAQPIDPARMFVTGASRCGFMTQWYLPRTRFSYAAAGTVITSMSRHVADSFELGAPTHYMMMIGDQDPFMPYGGADGPEREFDLLAAEDAIAVVARANGVDGPPSEITSFGDADPKDGCTNEVRIWRNENTGAETAFVKVVGGGHVAPGGRQYLPKSVVGPACFDFKHAEKMLEFFLTAPARDDAAPTPTSTGAPQAGASTSSNADEKYFGIETFTIVSEQTGDEPGTVVEHVRDWGRRRVEIYDTTVKLGSFPIPKKERIVHEGSSVVKINERNGQQTISTNGSYDRAVQARRTTPDERAADAIMPTLGGVRTGQRGTFAGADCDYWENRAINTKACVTPWGGALHLEIRIGQFTIDRRAVELRIGDGGPDAAFEK